MDDEFQDLQRLLRLKRHEAPPPEYFEDFLFEFQRRQRAELLQASAVASGVGPFGGRDAEFLAPRGTLTPGAARRRWRRRRGVRPHRDHARDRRTARRLVAVGKSRAVLTTPPAITLARCRRFDFNMPRRSSSGCPKWISTSPRQVRRRRQSSRPRYVLDTQPVSYEQSSSFLTRRGVPRPFVCCGLLAGWSAAGCSRCAGHGAPASAPIRPVACGSRQRA